MTNTYNITTERQVELESLGYYIEDMGEEYGEEFEGEYRWVNDEIGEFQDTDMSCSIEDAWVQANYFELTRAQ